MSDWVEEGETAPDFTLPADDGTQVKLSDLRGKPVVLYFYPKDDTPGCTKEACAFRDRTQDLKAKGAVVLGVSPDDVASHGKFRDKYSLNFPLLADVGHQVAERYGAWREKNMYGKIVDGHPALHLRDRRRRQGPQGLEEGQRGRPRRGRAGGAGRAVATPAPPGQACPARTARASHPSSPPRHRVNYAPVPVSSAGSG